MSRRILALALVAAVGAGCGSSTSGPTAAAISVAVEPARAVYRTGQPIALTATVTAADGTVLDDAVVGFTPTPVAAARAGGAPGEYTLEAAGRISFVGCVGAPERARLCDEVSLVVDDGAPVLELVAPTPGAELGGGGSTAIRVAGSVADARDVAVFVNGQPVELDALGRFEADVTPSFGSNHLEVVASDGLSEPSALELDVLWADAYLPATDADGRPAASFDDGISLQLAQRFFDDETPLDLTAAPLATRDLADVLELVLANADLTRALPDPVVDAGPTFFLRVPAVRVADVRATLDVTDTGAELFVRLGTVEVDTEGGLELADVSLDLAGGIAASVSAFARLSIGKDEPEGAVAARLDELSVAVESAEGRFASADANAVFLLAEGALRATLERELRNAFADTLASALPAVLTDALGALDTALRDQSIDLDTDILPRLTIGLDARVAALTTDFRRDLTATLRAKVDVDAVGQFPASRGAPQLTAPSEALFRSPPVQLAARLDLLNALLHGLWNAQLLAIDATSILPDSLSSVVDLALVDGQLPPVLRPPRASSAFDLVLDLGQLELELTSFGEITRFGVTIEAGVNVDVADGRIALAIAQTPTVHAWMIETESERPRIDADALEDLLIRFVWAELRGALADGLSLELPALEVGALGELAPALEGFRLQYEMNERVDVRAGYLVFDVGVVGRLP
jgi:hypothetical protein